MDLVTPVLPREGAWLASARAAEETVVQLDPIQARLDELLGRSENQGSLIRTLQATQVPLSEDVQETGWWTTETPQPQKQQNDDAWWHEDDQWNGRGWSQGWNDWSSVSWSFHNAKPTNNPTTVPTWNGDAPW